MDRSGPELHKRDRQACSIAQRTQIEASPQIWSRLCRYRSTSTSRCQYSDANYSTYSESHHLLLKTIYVRLAREPHMASVKSELQARSWRKDQFLVSTDPSLFPTSTLIDAFDSEDFYWAKTLPPQAMREIIENSLSFGLYEQLRPDDSAQSTTTLKLVGIARCVTDFITFAYLTDVWVDPAYQGKGLGTWLVQCVQEILEAMPHLRRSMLCTSDWGRSVPFYEKLMGMELVMPQRGEGRVFMERKGKGHPSYGS